MMLMTFWLHFIYEMFLYSQTIYWWDRFSIMFQSRCRSVFTPSKKDNCEQLKHQDIILKQNYFSKPPFGFPTEMS